MATQHRTLYQNGPPYSALPPPPTQPASIVQLIIRAVTLFPALFIMRLTGISSSSESTPEYLNTNFSGPDFIESHYRLIFKEQFSAQRRHLLALSAIISVAATFTIPSLRSAVLLDTYLPIWSILATLLFCGRYPIDTTLILTLICLKPYLRQSKRWGYYANGLVCPLAATLHYSSVLTAWHLLGFTASLHPLIRYATWISGFLLFREVVVLVNTGILLVLKAKALYDQYELRLLRAGFQINIVCTLLPTVNTDFSSLVPWRKGEDERSYGSRAEVCYNLEDHIRFGSKHMITADEIGYISGFVQGYTMMLPAEQASSIGEDIRMYRGIAPDDGTEIEWTWLREKLGIKEEDARVLYGELSQLVCPPEGVSYDTFHRYIDGAYEYNKELGRAIRNEETQLVDYGRVTIAIFITQAFLIWIFLTQSTTTKVFVVIPFVILAQRLASEIIVFYFHLFTSKVSFA